MLFLPFLFSDNNYDIVLSLKELKMLVVSYLGKRIHLNLVYAQLQTTDLVMIAEILGI